MTASVQPITGALTFETAPTLYHHSMAWFAGEGELVIDLARVTRVDSAGLALLIEWLRRARAANRPLRFTGMPPQVETLVRVNGLQDTLINHVS
ncbi:MAG: STAS domain-containing protein [Gammaproteobacteria bacterium]|nr:STAS domain-containing protein [Gammaproteobacteria bacterium]